MKRTIRPPERKTVTVCIAAACCAGTADQRLILCADGLMSSGLGKTDFRLKIRPCGGWNVLTAGRDDDIVATLEHMRTHVRGASVAGHPIVEDTALLAAVRASLAQRKREMADEIIQAQYAMSYADLLTVGKDQLPPEIYRDALLSVRGAIVDAEFIVAGFEQTGFPLIVETSHTGRVSIREKFAVIGAGAALAQSVLMHRQYSDFQKLSRAIYCVMEAKKYAEGEISVGQSTNVIIMDREGNCTGLTNECMEWMAELYSEYGPKDIPRELDEPDDLELTHVLTMKSRSSDGDA